MASIPFNSEYFKRLAASPALLARLPGVLTLVLVLMLASTAADLAWRLIPAADSTSAAGAVRSPSSAGGTSADGAEGESATLERIVSRNLFGEASPEPVNPDQPIDAPETGLNITLHGIIASGNPARSHAIISDGQGNEETYGVGDSLPGNASVEEIYADRVIIRRNGALEALRLPQESDGGLVSRTAGRSQRGGSSGIVSGGRVNMDSLRDQLLEDPQQLSELVRFRPVFQDGQFQGYRVYPGSNREAFEQVGLQAGDLVKEVNGVVLDRPDKSLELLNELNGDAGLNLVVDRDGNRQTLSVPLDN